jgi:ADP-ribose pyrophosphatase YjhB (NUDIX family)
VIHFERDGRRFNFRVAGVALRDERVLLQGTDHEPFWTLPGGRVEWLEPSPEALRREMREELGIEIHIERLIWVVENFFEYEGHLVHELSLLFSISFPSNPELYEQEQFEGDEGETRLRFRWFPLHSLDSVVLYPAFLGTALRSIPNQVTHVLHSELGGSATKRLEES